MRLYDGMFDDHNHTGQFGPPYDFNKQISCPKCVEEMLSLRQELCEKYEWDEWPAKLTGDLIGE